MDVDQMDRISPPNLIDLPQELLHTIVTDCNPTDLAAISEACRSLHDYVKSDKLLYKDLYLKHYDPPKDDIRGGGLHAFEERLKQYTRLEKRLSKTRPEELTDDDIDDLSKIVEQLITSASVYNTSPIGLPHSFSRNIAVLDCLFNNRFNKEALCGQSTLYDRARDLRHRPRATSETAQASAKLHVLCGTPIDPIAYGGKPIKMHAYARSVVYDLRRYTANSFWGPFRGDGSQRVDWEKLESIMLVIQYNLRQFHDRTNKRFPLLWHTPWAGIAPYSFISPIDWRKRKAEREAQAHARGDPEKDEETLREEARLESLRIDDPYNVTGTWMRVVCFLDYTDLFAYNFAQPQRALPVDVDRPPNEQEEAIRLITMKIHCTAIEPAGENQAAGTKVTHFEGTSRSMHVGWDPNANSGIRGTYEWSLKGTVSTTPEGEVRWTSFSVFHGEERWRSEGIQVGGPQSARGVWGSWFDKDFDPEGPAGPTAYWKLSDDLPPGPEKGTNNTAYNAANHAHLAQASYMPLPRSRTSTPRVDLGNLAGVFGAAAAPSRGVGEESDDGAENISSSEAAGGPETEALINSQDDDDNHPYHQTIVASEEDVEDEVLLEIEEDETGERRPGTITVPASTILQMLAGDDEDESEDDDYQPPDGQTSRSSGRRR